MGHIICLGIIIDYTYYFDINLGFILTVILLDLVYDKPIIGISPPIINYSSYSLNYHILKTFLFILNAETHLLLPLA